MNKIDLSYGTIRHGTTGSIVGGYIVFHVHDDRGTEIRIEMDVASVTELREKTEALEQAVNA